MAWLLRCTQFVTLSSASTPNTGVSRKDATAKSSYRREGSLPTYPCPALPCPMEPLPPSRPASRRRLSESAPFCVSRQPHRATPMSSLSDNITSASWDDKLSPTGKRNLPISTHLQFSRCRHAGCTSMGNPRRTKLMHSNHFGTSAGLRCFGQTNTTTMQAARRLRRGDVWRWLVVWLGCRHLQGTSSLR